MTINIVSAEEVQGVVVKTDKAIWIRLDEIGWFKATIRASLIIRNDKIDVLIPVTESIAAHLSEKYLEWKAANGGES